jgi:cysteinyl-tRNA synthetase
MDDILVRLLRHADYEVKHVQNITDVGHLSSDEDEGEDKMEKGARKYGQSAFDIAKKFEDYFFYSMDLMGIMRPTVSCRATDHVQSQLELVLDLEKKGLTYVIDGDGVYFDTSKLDAYGQLSGHDPRHAELNSRVAEVSRKRNPTDFALWKFEQVGEHRQMVWPSPWHPRSFPGWHVECSAMSIEHLGPQLDIHTGGIDHIAVHHANEIAQSESFTGKKPFAKFWVHHNFLRVDGEKMSKSLGNFFTIDDILAKGFAPQALRLLFLQSHYRSEQNFTWDSLAAAAKSLSKLQAAYLACRQDKDGSDSESSQQNLFDQLHSEFFTQLENDLHTSEALAVVWKLLKTDLSAKLKLRLLVEFDSVLGFGLTALTDQAKTYRPDDLPPVVQELFKQRERARQNKDWAKSDQLRQEIEEAGFILLDHQDQVEIRPVKSNKSL